MLDRKIILISGGSCSEKTTLSKGFKNATILSTDDFYVGIDKMAKPYNFDEPQAVDLNKLYNALCKLKKGNNTVIPKYSMLKMKPAGYQTVKPKDIIIVEGIFTLRDEKIRDLADLKIYINTPRKERLTRRIKRDIIKGRNEKETRKHSVIVDKMHRIYV